MTERPDGTARCRSIDALVEQFERALRAGQSPNLEQFLDEAAPADRAACWPGC